MNCIKYDYVVIGSGPGGQNAAIHAANSGKKVAIIEKEQSIGGHCVYKGTIPSKTLREAATFIYKMKKFGNIFDFKVREDLEVFSLLSRLDEVFNSHNDLIKEQLINCKIDIFKGKASFIDKNKIEVYQINGEKIILNAQNIIIATGSSPRVPNDIEIDHEHILDSDSILNLIYIPQSLIVLGGGVIACEYASIFALLGAKVTIIDRFERPLPFMDKELTQTYIEEFKSFGGEFKGNSVYKKVYYDGVANVVVELENSETITANKLLFALGRTANVGKLKLENADIKLTDRGLIAVNEYYQTNVENIYAVGDVIGFPALASTSMEQGRLAVLHSLGKEIKSKIALLPIGIYAVPEMSSIGLTEDDAVTKFEKIYVGRAYYTEIARAQISGLGRGFVKLITDEELNLLGIHIIGDNAAELIHIGEIALLNKNKVTIFMENIMNFPTMAEAYRIATLNIIGQFNNQK